MSDVHRQGSERAPLRLWPGGLLALALLVIGYVVPAIAPDAMIGEIPLALIGMLSGVALGAGILVWWLLFSRAAWMERAGAVLVMFLVLAATSQLVHASISNGMNGGMLFLFATPLLGLALVAWAFASRGLSSSGRWISMVTAFAIACSAMLLIRTGGISGDGRSDLHWRWTETPEERLLADAAAAPAASTANQSGAQAATVTTATADNALPSPSPAPSPLPGERASSTLTVTSPAVSSVDPAPVVAEVPEAPEPARAEWPGFRGPDRDGVVRGVLVDTAWPTSPPAELWRRPIGPAWSSFAVRGDLAYTQEQRGEDEIVAAYRVSTGEPVWQHRDQVRFWESNGGAGPRGTPTLHGERVYAMGAKGLLNALDATTGAVVWSRDTVSDTGKTIPDWGIASSPLVVGDVVVVAVAGRLAGYDAATGATRWMGQEGGGGYSSPHLAVIDGVTQVLLLRGARTISVNPADGTLLWDHVWEPAVSIVQPALVEGHDVLVASGDAMGGLGIRRLAIRHDADGWRAEERWTSRGLKPYFNDLVVHNGYAFGFDGSILSCIDLADGARKWKGGRYGHGQMVLLAEQHLLLILSEDGEIVLVNAAPDRFTEVARMRALEGKTWNHPVVVGDTLLVRNGEEMAAFRLATSGR